MARVVISLLTSEPGQTCQLDIEESATLLTPAGSKLVSDVQIGDMVQLPSCDGFMEVLAVE